MKILDEAFSCLGRQEELAFNAVRLMQPYVEDLDSIEYAFLNVSAGAEVADEIWQLRKRSCEQISKLFKRFSTSVDEDQQEREIMLILFPFFQDQFEVRLRLLGVYWDRMKAQKFRTANPDFESMGESIQSLAEFIQTLGDEGYGTEGHASMEEDARELSPLAA